VRPFEKSNTYYLSYYWAGLSGKIEKRFNRDSNAIFLAWAGDGFSVFRSIRVA
jgi:hypothetical protein